MKIKQQDKLYLIEGSLTQYKFEIIVDTFRISKETDKTISYHTRKGIISTIRKTKIQLLETKTRNQNGFYTFSTWLIDKKNLPMFINIMKERLQRTCAEEYFKLVNVYKSSLKKPKRKNRDFSGKQLDEMINLLNNQS